MKRCCVAALVVLLAFGAMFLACTKEGGGGKGAENARQDGKEFTYCETPEPGDSAYLKPGPVGDGKTWVITDGRAVTPVGDMVQVGLFPVDAVFSLDGRFAYVLCAGKKERGVDVVDLETLQVVGQVKKSTFYGIALSADGSKLYFSGADENKVFELGVNGAELTPLREFEVTGYPAGVALSPDGSYLLVCSNLGNRLNKIDLASGDRVAVVGTQVYPYAVAIDPEYNRAYVSNWGSDSVSVVDLGSFTVVSNIIVGKNPEGIVISPDGSRVYVANSDSDTISVIDAASLSVTRTISIHDDEVKTNGASPTLMDMTSDGKKLYVACAGYNAVYVVSTETGKVLGRIPSAWYPTSARLLPGGDKLLITNAKGLGSGPNPERTDSAHLLWGYIQRLDVPSSDTLAEYTQQVIENEKRAARFYEGLATDCIFPVPFRRGQPSIPIKHVVFIMKENKTFDQILGDLEGDYEVDPDLVLFGEDITPNAHALSRMFTQCDNFYSKAEASVQGHMWGTASNCNDYVEKAFLTKNRPPASGVEHAAKPEFGFIFHHLYRNNIPFRVYGQVVGIIGDADIFAPFIDFKYGFWNLSVSDEVKAKEFIREMNAGIFPSFVYMSLPNDHTEGSKPGAPTPRYLVADNDAGLGLIVDAISKSKYWKETVIFVTEDDPQSGADHIDAHRTLMFVISPWAKHGYVSHVLYSMDSMWMTIELLLGVGPMSTYDRYTAPMYDCFTSKPDFSTYDAIPNPLPYEENTGKEPFSAYCATLDFDAPDQIPNMGEILWAMYRPGEPFPKHLSVDYEPGEDEEEEAEEAAMYKKAVKRHIALGKKLKKQGKLDIEYIKSFYEQLEKAEKK